MQAAPTVEAVLRPILAVQLLAHASIPLVAIVALRRLQPVAGWTNRFVALAIVNRCLRIAYSLAALLVYSILGLAPLGGTVWAVALIGAQMGISIARGRGRLQGLESRVVRWLVTNGDVLLPLGLFFPGGSWKAALALVAISAMSAYTPISRDNELLQLDPWFRQAVIRGFPPTLRDIPRPP